MAEMRVSLGCLDLEANAGCKWYDAGLDVSGWADDVAVAVTGETGETKRRSRKKIEIYNFITFWN